MLKSSIYKGIEYIRISDLSLDQQSAIRTWASVDTIIKILQDKTLITDCVLYKDYLYWIENIYTEVSLPTETARNLAERKVKKIGLALDN